MALPIPGPCGTCYWWDWCPPGGWGDSSGENPPPWASKGTRVGMPGGEGLEPAAGGLLLFLSCSRKDFGECHKPVTWAEPG